jgi:hypothetical protein
MIKNKMALLGAVTTFGMMGGAFASPAQAILLSAGGTLTAGGYTVTLDTFSVSGGGNLTTWGNFDATFEQNGQTNNYIFDIGGNPITTPGTYVQQYSITGPAINSFLTTMNSFATTGSTQIWSDSFGGTSVASLAVPSSTPTSNLTTLFVRNTYVVGSDPASFLSSASNQVTAVPWETDALSVIGVTTLFGFGVWTKRKRKVDLSK